MEYTHDHEEDKYNIHVFLKVKDSEWLNQLNLIVISQYNGFPLENGE